MKVKMKMTFHGYINGQPYTARAGDIVEGKRAEVIARLQPTWVEILNEPQGSDYTPPADRQMRQYTRKELQRRTKNELAGIAVSDGVKVNANTMTKKQMIDAMLKGR